MEVPFEFHRFIIGKKGDGVRALMNLHDVNIKVPSAEEQSNTIVVTGAPANVENAKADLHDRVKDLEAEKADKELKSFDIQLDIKPEYHPKIIGRKGAVITKLRMDYRVNIQLPKKDDPEASIITITGYEKDANEAKIAIQKIVGDFVSFFSLLSIDIYSVIIYFLYFSLTLLGKKSSDADKAVAMLTQCQEQMLTLDDAKPLVNNR